MYRHLPPRGDGGQWTGTEQERLLLLCMAIAEGADYVDLEEDIAAGDSAVREDETHRELPQLPRNAARSPQVIQIEGARTEIARVVVLKTEPIDITGLRANLEQEVRLNMDGRNIRTKISDVNVKIRIEGAGK